MSRYRTLVILPQNATPASQADAERFVRDLLAPYDENIQVDPYPAPCSCADYTDDKQPDPECEDCHGSGTYQSTYNPKSKWDYWVIGGRYTRTLHPAGRNIFPVHELAPYWSAYAIVTPDGTWHSKGRMGWWGISHNDDDLWKPKMYEIASAFPEHTAVVCDLHI